VGRRSTRSSVASRPPASRSSARCAGTPHRSRVIFVLCGFFAWLLPGIAAANSESQVKAAFLFNFARYVEWPEAAFDGETAAIRLCLLSEAGFEQVLSETVSGRSVGRRPVSVETIGGLEAANGCHLLFIDASVPAPASAVAGRLGELAVFTISDQEGFAAAGGIANFIFVDQKVRFEINPSAARRAGLKISSSLLRLAKLVGNASP
jgi:hypothetical protein